MPILKRKKQNCLYLQIAYVKKKKKNLKTPHTKQKLLELINSGNLQDIKSISKIQLHFYTLTTKYQKDRLEKQSHFITASKRIKHLRINLTS